MLWSPLLNRVHHAHTNCVQDKGENKPILREMSFKYHACYVLFFVAKGQNERTVVRTPLWELALQSDFDPVVTLKNQLIEEKLVNYINIVRYEENSYACLIMFKFGQVNKLHAVMKMSEDSASSFP